MFALCLSAFLREEGGPPQVVEGACATMKYVLILTARALLPSRVTRATANFAKQIRRRSACRRLYSPEEG